jgi:hypothetical protein
LSVERKLYGIAQVLVDQALRHRLESWANVVVAVAHLVPKPGTLGRIGRAA